MHTVKNLLWKGPWTCCLKEGLRDDHDHDDDDADDDDADDYDADDDNDQWCNSRI
jgi:hypothetical protein